MSKGPRTGCSCNCWSEAGGDKLPAGCDLERELLAEADKCEAEAAEADKVVVGECMPDEDLGCSCKFLAKGSESALV
jgi:hypothetical protein